MAPAEAAELTARAALAAHAAVGVIADAPFRAIRGGLSNHAWHVERDGHSYFVRLGGRGSKSLGVDRRSECHLLGAASAAGLAPEVLVCDPDRDLLVTRFVRAATWTRQDARKTENLRRFGATLRTLHSLSLCPGIERISFSAQATLLENQLGGAEGAQPALRRVAVAAFEMLAGREAIVALCHNDLHHLNILDDGDRLWFVDWEYGGCGDPLFDLASFLCQLELTHQQRQVLFSAYAGESGISIDLVEAACRVFDYVQWLWYRLRSASEPGEAGEHSFRAEVIAQRLLSGVVP